MPNRILKSSRVSRWTAILFLIAMLGITLPSQQSGALASDPVQTSKPQSIIPNLVVDGLRGPWTPSALVLDDEEALHMVVEGVGVEGAGIYYIKAVGHQVATLKMLSTGSSRSLNPDILYVNGILHVVWQDNLSGIDQIYHRYQVDDIWSDIVQVSSSQIGARFPEIKTASDGYLQMQWREITSEDQHVYSCVWSGLACMETQLELVPLQLSDLSAQPVAESLRTIAYLYYGDIYTIREDGTNRIRLTTSGTVSVFVWSPNGQQIAYMGRDSNYQSEIFVMNADGSNVRQLTLNSHASRWVIDWHANKIAFMHDTDTYPMIRVSYIDVNDPDRTVVPISPEIENWGIGFNITTWPMLRWSPNGQWIAFSHGLSTGVVSSDGVTYRPISMVKPEWKNDSSHVIFTPLSPDTGIRIFNPTTNTQDFASYVSAKSAVYSPNDTYVAYTTASYLKRMNADDTGHMVLAYRLSADQDWSPTGDKLVYASWDDSDGWGSYTGVRVLNANGSGSLILATGDAHHPMWQVKKFRPNPDGYRFDNEGRNLPSWDVFKQTFSNSNLEYSFGIPKLGIWLFYKTTYRETLAKGVCGGMSASALAYYRGIEARPDGANTTFSISENAAWPLIELYQGRFLSKGVRNQMIPLWRSNPGVDAVYNQIKSQISNMIGEPLVISFAPGPGNSLPEEQRFGHAVVPYGIWEETNSWAVVYVYDPNYPDNPVRYLFFDFRTSPASFEYNMGFPIPRSGDSNYRIRSNDGWVIMLTPISQFGTYDAKVLEFGALGRLAGGEVVHSDSRGQQLGYVQGTLISTIPDSAPLYSWIAPNSDANALGFTLPVGEYRAAISSTGTYEYMVSSNTSALYLTTQVIGTAQSDLTAASSGVDYINIGAPYVGTTYSSTLSTDRTLSLQIAGDLRQYGILNGTMTTMGSLHAEALGNNLYLETSGMTSTFDLDIQGSEGDALGWFVHRGITMTTSAAMTIVAPALTPSSVVTVSVAYAPGGPIQHVWILDNQIKRVFLPLIHR